MIKKHFTDVKEEIVTKANSTKTTIRRIITKEDGAENFSIRTFEIEASGQIGLHDHPEDHEFYILHGTAHFIDKDDNKVEVNIGDVIYMPPNEPHGIINIGNDTFIFICIIPYL